MIRVRKIASLCAASGQGWLGLPCHQHFMLGTSADNRGRKWRAFQDNINDAIVRSNLPTGLDKLLLQAFEVSKDLKTLVEKDEPITREMVAVLAIMPVHQVDKVPWMEDDGGQEAQQLNPHVHPRRLSRWQKLQEQCQPSMTPAEQQRCLIQAWNEIIRDEYQKGSEPIDPVDPKLFDGLKKNAAIIKGKPEIGKELLDFVLLGLVYKSLTKTDKIELFVENPPADRPEIGLTVLFPSCPVPVFCELGCKELNAGIFRVLMACEAEGSQRAESFHEAVGVVSSGDKWVLLRSQDERIVIDDGPGNVLEYDEVGHPTRGSAERIMGKLHSLLSGSFSE